MPAFVEPSVLTLLTWAVLWGQFTGLGLLALRAVNRGARHSETVFSYFWVGLAATLAWLQIWSLWLPISWLALVAPFCLGVVGWIAPPLPAVRQVVRAWRRWQLALATALIVLWAAVTAQAPLDVYDAGTYHLSALRWASTYPVVPGLGNLNPALGLSSSLFLYLASLSVGNLAGFHIAIGLLFVVLLVELSVAALRRPTTFHAWLAGLLILPTLVFIGINGLSTTTYDAGGFVLGLVMTRRLMRLLDQQRLSRSGATIALFVIASLAFGAITVKIANAPFSGACVALAVGVVLSKHKRTLVPTIGLIAALALIQLGPWLMRNAVLTGYLLYPIPVFGLPFDWTMPEATVRAYRDTLSDFARVHGPNFEGASAGFAWLGIWLARNWRDVVPPALIGLLAGTVLLMYAPRRLNQKCLILIPLWIGFVAWFISSPDPRYAAAVLWLVGVVPLAFCVASISGTRRIVLLVAFIAIVEMPNVSYLLKLVQLTSAIVSGEFVDTPDVPTVPLSVTVTNSGLKVYGPPDYTDQVWDAPLPTSFWRPDPNLRTRCADSLGCGFAVH